MKLLSNYLANPISVLIATIFTFINFLVILLPFYLLIIFFILSSEDNKSLLVSNNIFIYTTIFMFILTIIYLFLDLFFGFTVATLVKDCKDISTLEGFSLHKKLFDETLNEFDMDDVKFLLQESEDVNTFAVLTLRKKYVVVTTAMLNHITNSFPNIEEQKLAIKGMIAHELSHLLNWDSLPNLILLSGQNIAYYLSTALAFILNIILLILSYIPITAIFSLIVRVAFNILQLGLNLVYTKILHPTYLLVERFLGRLNEYRSDYQSAEALSWKPMHLCLYSLLLLDGNTYHSNFSTHPNTISRVLYIYKVERTPINIGASFVSKYFSILLLALISICVFYLTYEYFDRISEVSVAVENYLIQSYESTKNFLIYLYDSNLYIFIFIAIIPLYLIYKISKKVILAQKIKKVIKTINKSENTDIDFLLYFAIQNNDLHSFLNILKCGANINTTNFEKTIEIFTQEVNPEFIKHIDRVKN